MKHELKTLLWFLVVIGFSFIVGVLLLAGNRFANGQVPTGIVLTALGSILLTLICSTLFILGDQAGKEFADPAYKDRSWIHRNRTDR